MLVNCKIISNNHLLYNKFKEFIQHTPFFVLFEEKTNISEDEQIIFWDIDTINFQSYNFKERIENGTLIIVISSLLSKDIISNFFEQDHFYKIGIMNKSIQYPEFVEEISRMVDNVYIKSLKD